MSRATIAAGAALNTPQNLRAVDQDPNHFKPGALMPAMQLSDRQIDASRRLPDRLCIRGPKDMADADPFPISGSLRCPPARARRRSWLEWLHGWVVTVDHKKLGILYIVYALFFLLVAGAEAW